MIGFTSWSQTLRLMVEALQPLRTRTEHVVELLGDLGPPELQHEAARVHPAAGLAHRRATGLPAHARRGARRPRSASCC